MNPNSQTGSAGGSHRVTLISRSSNLIFQAGNLTPEQIENISKKVTSKRALMVEDPDKLDEISDESGASAKNLNGLELQKIVGFNTLKLAQQKQSAQVDSIRSSALAAKRKKLQKSKSVNLVEANTSKAVLKDFAKMIKGDNGIDYIIDPVYNEKIMEPF